jgi:WD40 repeat protein
MVPTEFGISPAGRLVGVTALTASIWDVSTDHRLATQLSVPEPDQSNRVIFSQDGRLMATNSDTTIPGFLVGTVEVFDTRTGRHVATLESPPHSQQPAAFSHDGTRVLTVSDDSTIRGWDTRSGKLIAVLASTGNVNAAAFSTDDQFVAASSDNGTLRVWDANTSHIAATYPIQTADDTMVAFAPSGPTVIVAGNGIVQDVRCTVCRSFDELLNLAKHRTLSHLTPQERREFLHS